MSRLSEDVFSFPLREVTDKDIKNLLHSLWGWEPCVSCHNQVKCIKADCASTRLTRLNRYIQYYHQTTTFYEPEQLGGNAALSTHDDLCSLIASLRARTGIPRTLVLQELFGPDNNCDFHSMSDQQQALNLAVQVMTMVDTTEQIRGIRSAEDGLVPAHWSSDLPLAKHMSKLFPKSDHPSVNKEDQIPDPDFEAMLRASVLQKRANLKFRPTNNLQDHLKLDRGTRSIEIFHHTSFLKEHLRASNGVSRTNQLGSNNEWDGGLIPRQLALEVLDSIQKVIFPLTDQKSKRILQTLVSKSNFDPDCLRFDSASIRTPEEQHVAYHYFGARLADLYEEVQNPKPDGYFEEWLQRKSGARHVMLATLFGVAIAILLGILALAVSVYQAYIGYMAWKHPVTNR